MPLHPHTNQSGLRRRKRRRDSTLVAERGSPSLPRLHSLSNPLPYCLGCSERPTLTLALTLHCLAGQWTSTQLGSDPFAQTFHCFTLCHLARGVACCAPLREGPSSFCAASHSAFSVLNFLPSTLAVALHCLEGQWTATQLGEDTFAQTRAHPTTLLLFYDAYFTRFVQPTNLTTLC